MRMKQLQNSLTAVPETRLLVAGLLTDAFERAGVRRELAAYYPKNDVQEPFMCTQTVAARSQISPCALR